MQKILSWLIINTLVVFTHPILSVNRAYSASSVYVNEDAQYIYAGNQYLELAFQKSDGKLHGIKHKATNTDFIKEKNAYWSLYDFLYYKNGQPQYVHGGFSNSFTHSSRTIAEGMALDLYWNGFTVDGTALNMNVGVTIEVKDNSPLSYWTISITNNESITIEGIDFPFISGLGQISLDPEMDFGVLPSMSGMLFQNPLGNSLENGGWGWEMYYPSAYSTMQFMGYYGTNPAAGLYIASYDRGGNSKFFSLGKSTWLGAQIRHIPEFVEGSDYRSGYPSIIGVFSGDWYDAAQIYRSWALQQPWTSKGPLATRSDIPSWYSSAGLRQWIYTHPICLTDANPFSIVSEVMKDTATYLGHSTIAGWIGWEHQGWYLEYPEVFPPKEGWDAFRQAIKTTHESGNRIHFVPNSASYSSSISSWTGAEPYAVRDRFGNYPSPFSYSECGMTTTFYRMCPATSFWQGTLKSMLTTLAQEGADVIQLDGFPIFGPQPCVDPTHGHPKGGGAWWYNNYRQIFNDFKVGARQISPDLILSSEGMAEIYIPLLDNFSDPFTTGWSPNSVISVFKDPLKVQLIPLWHAVYHDYAFLDSGIVFFSRNAPTGAVGYGDYRDFYVRGFGLALIWGEMPDTWYSDEKISSLNEQAEWDMANYLRRIVDARTGYAQPYLVYGRMLKPPALNVPLFRINAAQNIPYTLDNYPAFDSPAILSSVWMAPSGEVGYIFTNISNQSVTFNLTISPSEISLPSSGPYAVIQNRNGSQSTLFKSVNLPQTLSIQIEPLDVLLIKVVSPFSGGLKGSTDFDGDGKKDILWRRTTTGTVALWLMNGLDIGSVGVVAAIDSSWQIKGVGDFNGDGKADILWQHTSGTVALWLMNGSSIGSVGIPGAIDSSWQIKGVGDFDRDGKSDVLWQHSSGTIAVWLMNGTAIGSMGVPGSIDSSWQIKGIGDFNGDGKADVLWQHTSGTVAVWLMNGTSVGSVGIPGAIDSSWQIKGVGDFNGDGKADILWQHSSGTIALWLMNGTSIGSVGIPGVIDSSWQIKGIGDFNGDGKADVLWQHTGGTVAIWLMNGLAIGSVGVPGAVADPNWKIVE